MTPYRDAAEMPIPTSPAKAVGLVRLNGSACTCKPPGRLWCWWYGVQLGDRWQCVHGGAWIRWREPGEMAAWRTSGMLSCGWETGTPHPMSLALGAMGWTRKTLLSGRSSWAPPAPESSRTDTESK
jgi:hypothetical protein